MHPKRSSKHANTSIDLLTVSIVYNSRFRMDMISLHGIVLGFSELALVIGANGLQQVADAVRQIPVCYNFSTCSPPF